MRLFYNINHVKCFLIYKTFWRNIFGTFPLAGRIADFEFSGGGGARAGEGCLSHCGESAADARGDLKPDRAAAFAQCERKIFGKRRKDFCAA